MAAPFNSVVRVLKFSLATALALLTLAPSATASVGVGSNAATPVLRVDAQGNAEISYSVAGAKKTVLVPATGAVLPGGTITGADVTHAVTSPALPYVKVLRA